MFKKTTRRNFRQRKCESSEEDGNEKGDDDDNETQLPSHNIKPSKLPQSRGISCSSKPQVSPSKSDSSGAEDALEEFESVIAKSQLKEDASKKNVLSFSYEKAEGSEFKLKKSREKDIVFKARNKEASPVKITRRNAKKDVISNVHHEEPSESDESMEDIPVDSDDDDSVSTMSSASNSSVPQPVTIPDARKIQSAKEQRRRARSQRDYLPLDGDRESTPGTGEEEDVDDEERESDDEPDDHERRIQFAPKPQTLRERMAEKMGGSDSEDRSSDSQEEEDQSLWEEQQIGKGVKRRQKSNGNSPVTVRQKKKVAIPLSLPPVSIHIIKKRITGKLDSLTEVHRARQAELRRMQFDMDSARSSLEQLEGSRADEQLDFYRGMRVYADNLVECLAEKVVLMNSAEMDMHTLHIDQAEALLSSRREAVREESSRLQQLAWGHQVRKGKSRKGKSQKLTEKTLHDFSRLSLSEVNPDPHSSEAAEGSSGETQGRLDQRCEEADWGSAPADSEPLPEDEAELQRRRADILKSSQDIFADVQEDFSDIKKILSRFDEWRVSFPDSYNNAYISLCLPKLLGPLIRHQLIGWNPLKAEGEDFEALPWYSAVEKFCHGTGYEESENADKKTLPAIIEKTILPKVQGFVELVWDPLSSKQSQSLTTLCQRLQDDYSVFDGEQSKPVKAFVEAVALRLTHAVDDDVFIPLYPKKYLDDPSSPQCRFRDQQFWSAVKLLGNIVLWDGLLPEHVLKGLALDKLLNRYLMMTLLNETSTKHSVEKCRKVAACFPKSWFKDVDSGSSLPQLKNFSNHLLQMGRSLSKTISDPTSKREILADLLTLMRNIKAQDDMTAIAEKYCCEDLIDSHDLS